MMVDLENRRDLVIFRFCFINIPNANSLVTLTRADEGRIHRVPAESKPFLGMADQPEGDLVFVVDRNFPIGQRTSDNVGICRTISRTIDLMT